VTYIHTIFLVPSPNASLVIAIQQKAKTLAHSFYFLTTYSMRS